MSNVNPFRVKDEVWGKDVPGPKSLMLPVVTPTVPKIGSDGEFKVTVPFVPQPVDAL
jgi:hypothetical protein